MTVKNDDITPRTGRAGSVFAHDEIVNAVHLHSFAGHAVPEDGVTVPAQGGSLTVWPDGHYVMTPAEHDGTAGAGQDAVVLYYPYVWEDVDGSFVAGSFAVDAVEGADPSVASRAWSVADILTMEAALENATSLTDTAALHFKDVPGLESLHFSGEAPSLEDIVAPTHAGQHAGWTTAAGAEESSGAGASAVPDLHGGSGAGFDELDHMIKAAHHG